MHPLPAPDDDSPAYRALRDQYDSACEHARRYARALVRSGGGRLVGPVTTAGPWTEAVLASVAPRPGRRRGVCEHLAAERSPRPVFVALPHLLTCYHCLMLAMDNRLAQPVEQCDRCGRPSAVAGETSVVIAQRDLVIAWGLLCPGCLAVELATAA